jgi:tRNA-dihydrouridine synthase 3
VPVIGNGDVLSPFEAEARERASGVRAVMVGRGALIKPWIFRELREGRPWLPTAEERLAVYARLVALMREYFGADERGERRILNFLPWHFGFFHRYRPIPDTPDMRERAAAHPLLQSRLPEPPTDDPLERLLLDDRATTHEAIAKLLLAEPAGEGLVARARELASSIAPPAPHEPAALELQTQG